MKDKLLPLKKVLIFHSSGLGDWLMFSPVLKRLIEVFPDLRPDVFLGTAGTRALVEMYPKIGNIFFADARGSKVKIARELWRARRTYYDAILFTAGMNSRKVDLLAGTLRGKMKVAIRHGEHRLLFLTAVFPLDGKIHRVENNLKLLDLLGLTRGHAASMYFPPIHAQDPVLNLLIHPGCERNLWYKRWPIESYVSLIRDLLSAGQKVSVLLGRDEIEFAPRFSEFDSSPNFRIITNKPLRNVIEIISRHKVVLTNDSGIGHLAAAMNRQTVTIFGPANPRWVKPFQSGGVIVRAESDLDCRPCIKPGGQFGCANRPCLTEITPDRVLKAIMPLL